MERALAGNECFLRTHGIARVLDGRRRLLQEHWKVVSRGVDKEILDVVPFPFSWGMVQLPDVS
jgi:hypothetical protein